MKALRWLAVLLTLCLLTGCVAACGSQTTTPTTDLYGEEETPEDTSGTTDSVPTESAGTTDGTSDVAGDPTQTPTSTTASTTSKSPSGTKTTSTTKQPSKQAVTYTTASTTTATTKDKTKGKAIKILAIGNSFSVDAMQNHLFPLFESAGYTDITLGNLYIGGCSLDTHYNNLKGNVAAYTFYLNTDGEWEKTASVAPSTGLAKAQWDVVTVQQVSSDSGRAHSYANLQKTLDIVKKKAPRAKILWHMTWAYQQNSSHEAFGRYNKDQMTMYQAIVAAVQQQVKPLADIDGIIPAGTAIQNLRTSDLGDTLTSDGHHLKDSYGDYTAALTWFCAITGEDPEAVGYCPGTVNDHWDEMAQSVRNALKKPFEVTKCK